MINKLDLERSFNFQEWLKRIVKQEIQIQLLGYLFFYIPQTKCCIIQKKKRKKKKNYYKSCQMLHKIFFFKEGINFI